MDGQFDVAVQQRLLQLLREQALTARFGQGPVLDFVTGRLDHVYRDEIGVHRQAFDEKAPGFSCLRQGERASLVPIRTCLPAT